MNRDVSFPEAQRQVSESVAPLTNTEEVPLPCALNRVVAQDIFASEPYPAFDNSAVDGFALSCEEDACAERILEVSGTLYAGDNPAKVSPLKPGFALKVFTGSALPPETYAVIMQEDVAPQGDAIRLLTSVPKGKHIRRKGEDFPEGDLLIPRGFCLNSGGIALLASQGIQKVSVFAKPRVAVITTGDELVPPSEKVLPGKIRDTNSFMLASLLKNTKPELHVTHITHCPDDPEKISKMLTEIASENDVILISGGASVGERDHIRNLVAHHGQIILHGVKMKPGKPFLFGKIGECWIFGLPGNPASAFVCFHLFGKPALQRLSGLFHYHPRWLWVRLLTPLETGGRDEFVRANLTSDPETPEMPTAILPAHQGSFGLRSLALGECLVWVPAHTDHQPGELRLALLLDS